MLKNVPLPTKKRYLTVKERELHDLFQKIANFWAVSVKQVATIVGPREHEYPHPFKDKGKVWPNIIKHSFFIPVYIKL